MKHFPSKALTCPDCTQEVLKKYFFKAQRSEELEAQGRVEGLSESRNAGMGLATPLWSRHFVGGVLFHGTGEEEKPGWAP